MLGVAAAVGGGFTLYDTAQQAANGNWAGVAYNVGTFGGSAAAGAASGAWVRTGITGETSGWSLGKDLQQGYQPNYPGGSFGKWLGTGPNLGSAAGATAAIGAGISKALIAAERRKLTPDQAIETVREKVGEAPIVLCSLTIAEIGHGIYRANSPETRNRRRSFLDELKATVPIHRNGKHG